MPRLRRGRFSGAPGWGLANTGQPGRGGAPLPAAAGAGPNAAQPARALASLVADGLVTESNGAYALGGGILHR